MFKVWMSREAFPCQGLFTDPYYHQNPTILSQGLMGTLGWDCTDSITQVPPNHLGEITSAHLLVSCLSE